MGVLFVVGTVALVALIVQRAGGLERAGRTLDLALDQPPGSRIGGIATVEGGLLAVWVQRPDGTEGVMLVDARRSRALGEIGLGPPAR